MNHKKFLSLINLQHYEQYSFLNNLIFISLEYLSLNIPDYKMKNDLQKSLDESTLFSEKQKHYIFQYLCFCLDSFDSSRLLRNLLRKVVI